MGMSTNAISLFIFFALLHLVFLNAAEKEDPFYKDCQPFRCGNLGELQLPFTNATRAPYCGPFVVDDCDKRLQKIQLVKGGKQYEVESISQGNTLLITDKEFQRHLDSNSCLSFNNLSFPSIPCVSFQITSNLLSLFKCNRTVHGPPDFYFNYTGCNNFNIFYNASMNTKNLPSLPRNCSILQFPVNNSKPYDDIFGLLTAKFSLEVQIQYPCYFRTYRGGKCQNGTCVSAKDTVAGNQKKLGLMLGLALGLGCPAAIIIIWLSLNFIWHRCNRKHASSNFLAPNTPSDPSTKSDLERVNACFGVRIFSYTELEEATSNFDSEKELGNGGFGVVYYGKLKDGQEVAVKRLYEHNYKRVKQFMNEIQILTLLRHKNLVSLYGCTSSCSRELLLVYEYIPNGTVADHLHCHRAKSSPLTWPIRMRIAVETASALAYLHASGIIHRDVKTNNILLENNFSVKVADFGLSRLFPNDVTHISTAPQGTPGYVDPDYHQCYQLTTKSDVYSFGVVLIELISSMPAVDMNRHRHEINLAILAINKIQKGAFDELIDPFLWYKSDGEVQRMTTSVAELAFLCLQQDRELRPEMNEVLKELERIESGEYELENLEERHDNNEALKSIESPPSPSNCHASLLKNIQPPHSPDSVIDKWVSSSSTVQKTSG